MWPAYYLDVGVNERIYKSFCTIDNNIFKILLHPIEDSHPPCVEFWFCLRWLFA